ncbi:MAG: hypothetical protein JSV16_16385 [Candidatus Hydrogenedentota bacterium]|nr:MAG: hypothetical protein JSV16_16385 [Candidatus Hydrogenedentota bacterium]
MLGFAKTHRNKAIAAVIVVMLLFASAGCSGKVAAKTEKIAIVPEGEIIIDGECYDWT